MSAQMKCEICHQADAETVLLRGEGEAAEELYVCKACAKADRQRRQKKSQRTRKSSDLPPGVSMTITRIRPVDPDAEDSDDADGDEEAPPIVKAFMHAMDGMVSDIEKAEEESRKSRRKEAPYHEFPLARLEAPYRYRGHLHLEGLHLIGELEAVKRAFNALDMKLAGGELDGVRDPGHAFAIGYRGSSEQAKRVVGDLLREERNARVRLFEEMPRVFGDSLCRALAILKNARLLSPAELFDLLSPLRLAALEKMLDGVTLKEIEKIADACDLSNHDDDDLEPGERDRIDAERADEMNKRFEDVVLNERAEEKFL